MPGSQHDKPRPTGRAPAATEAGHPAPRLIQASHGSHYEPSVLVNVQVKAMVDRTYHDANHSVLFAGAPLPVHLLRSRAVKGRIVHPSEATPRRWNVRPYGHDGCHATHQHLLRHRDHHVLRRSPAPALPCTLRRAVRIDRHRPAHLAGGMLPPRVLGQVFEWGALHQEELLADWTLVSAHQPPAPIPPLA